MKKHRTQRDLLGRAILTGAAAAAALLAPAGAGALAADWSGLHSRASIWHSPAMDGEGTGSAEEARAWSNVAPARAPLALTAAADPGDASELLGRSRIDDDALQSRRGGTLTRSEMNLDGVVGSNTASNLTTGANTISSGSLSGSAGLPVVIQNSGNNVLIQNATIVNVQLK